MDLVIGLAGVAALLLCVSDRRAKRVWGSVIGLMGQPFWLWQTWHAQLWGIFVLSVFWALAYAFNLFKECRHDQG